MENLTAVIPFYRGHATLRRLLNSLPPDLFVLVVDDGYSAGEDFPDLSEREGGRVSVLHLPEKGYFAGAVNAGIRACTTDVLVLNQDVRFEGDGWQGLIEDNRQSYALIGERITGDHPAFPQGYVHGVFMYMRRDALDTVGLLNERDYPLWGGTAEWQCRATRKGFAVLPVVKIPGLRHERKAGERYGSSIKQLLTESPERKEWLVRTPPAISVVVPCHNYGRFLPDCIASLIGGQTCLGPHPGQTLQSFEVVIVDDASKDNTPEVGQALASDWTGVRYYRLDKNAGTARALNYGIERAVGKYITFLSADDMREAESLEHLYRAAEANPHRFVYDDVRLFNGRGRQKVWRIAEYDFEGILHKNTIPAGILYPRQAWQEVGGYPAIMHDGREDWAFNVALGIAGYCGVHVDHVGYLYRRDGQNRSLRNTTPQHHTYFYDKIRGLFPAVYGGHRPMGCCGKGQRQNTPAAQGAPRPLGSNMPGAGGMTQIQYLGNKSLFTQAGEVSRAKYRFGITRRIGYVDKRDVGQRGVSGLLNVREKGQWQYSLYRPVDVPKPAEVEPVPEKDEYLAEPEPETTEMPVVVAELPDPSELTVAEIRALELPPEQWAMLIEVETDGKARKTALEHMREHAGA